MTSKSIKNMTLAALFLALGLVLPFLTGQIKEIGSMLLPMHIPVLLCGFICGWPYGLAVGFITPLLRFVLFGMPRIPNAYSMALELATYGLVTGILYQKILKTKLKTLKIYISLISAMITGRVVWGIASILLLISGISQTPFTWQAFISGAILSAIPGIILQLILIPILLLALEKAGVMEK